MHRVVDIDEVPRLAPGEVCVICTGSQGEPMSALSLMAAHEHKYLKVSEDDVVVISAHAIPGNESNVARVIDSLYRAGADVVHEQHCAGARVGPRVAGRAEVHALARAARVVHPGARRVPPPGPPRAARRSGGRAVGSGVHLRRRRRRHARRPTSSRSNGARCPAGYQYVDGIIDDISPRACCATAATSPRRAWSWCS